MTLIGLSLGRQALGQLLRLLIGGVPRRAIDRVAQEGFLHDQGMRVADADKAQPGFPIGLLKVEPRDGRGRLRLFTSADADPAMIARLSQLIVEHCASRRS